MADFLANLAARSLGLLPSVRPRSPSRFERDAGPVQERPIDEFEVEREPARRVVRTAAPLASRVTGPQGEETVASAERSHFDVDREATQAVTTVVEHVRQAPEPNSVAEPLAETVPVLGDRERAPDPPLQDRAQPAIELEREAAPSIAPERYRIKPPKDSAEASPSAVSTIPLEHTTKLIREQTDDPAIAAQADWMKADSEPPVDVLRVPTRIAGPASEAELPARSAPVAPQVTVSIGRIEVKAAPRPEPVRPVQASARPQPALSLGEYLERSRKGRR